MERAGRFLLAQQRHRPQGALAGSFQPLGRRQQHYHRLARQQLSSRLCPPSVQQTGAAALAAASQGRVGALLLPVRRRMGTKEGGGKGEEAGAAGAEQQEQGQQDGEEGKKQEGEQGQEDPEPDPEEPQERIGVLRGLLYLTVFGLAMGSLYFIADELMPTRMSANHLFNEAFDAVKANHEVLNRYGEPLKGYGRDGGGRREGRRNFVEHKNYVAEDGTKRLRIRFNIEGPFGHAFVFAEVTSDMPKGQWMYLLVQDLQTGRVLTVEDNRAMHDALGKAKSEEEREAIKALIQSGGGGR